MSEPIVLEPLDRLFAEELLAHEPEPRPEALRRAAEAVSAWRRLGHTCIPLSELEGVTAEALRQTRCVGRPGDFTPLILDDAGRLYLRRYHAYETQTAAAIRQRLRQHPSCDQAILAEGLRKFFSADPVSDQARAARTAVERAFCVITGGPGTGKTHTIAVVLALLHAQFPVGHPPRIALAAPTGKAAARMKESIQRMVDTNPAFAGLGALLPREATTIHRLLGVIPNAPDFRHNADHPLPVDVVILDEASMTDLALMARLILSLPAQARLILLGDRDQLAAVEAGNVLGDLCGRGLHPLPAAPIATHIVALRKNYRFEEGSGIHRISQQVNAGDDTAVLASLGERSTDFGATLLPRGDQLRSALRARGLPEFRELLADRDPMKVLSRLNDFRLLCALRTGPFGVVQVNTLLESLLDEAGLIDARQPHYPGRPIIITRNDYQLGLFNGDTGILLPDPANPEGGLRVWFPDEAGGVRSFNPGRLPAHETVFAMTVHKSQGSEFRRVLFLLPDRPAPVLTRELIYTGLTRARDHVELWYEAATLRTAIRQQVERTSGLRDALWAGNDTDEE